MVEHIDAPVSVNFVFDHKKRLVYPSEIIWGDKTYKIKKIGMHHSARRGRTLYHFFSVVSDTLFFRLVLNTETLFWRLEQISDGLAD